MPTEDQPRPSHSITDLSYYSLLGILNKMSFVMSQHNLNNDSSDYFFIDNKVYK
jgi:hypothetical protein